MKSSIGALVVAVTLMPALATGQAEKSLAKCQTTVGKEIGKYVATRHKVIAKCLDRIARERIANAAGHAAGAAKSCAAAFRRIRNTEDSAKQLDHKSRLKIAAACQDPALEHSIEDVLGIDLGGGFTVTGDRMNVRPQMAIPCFHLGHYPNTVDAWLDCLIASADAKAVGLVHMQYPNADAWLRDVRPDIDALDDPNIEVKITDALAALDSVRRWVDNGDGTVTDHVTGLMWEKKTDDGGIHDKDDTYTWSSSSVAPDGTVFTSFLDTLNGGPSGVGNCETYGAIGAHTGGFAQHCDWRLPTVTELQTILLEPYPCATSPCIDEDVFGPTMPNKYWTASTFGSLPDGAFFVGFADGEVFDDVKFDSDYVRAVRRGF